MAAKAHPADEGGKGMVRKMAGFAARPDVSDRAVFLSDYDIDLAQHLQPGVDVWINTPRRPNEGLRNQRYEDIGQWGAESLQSGRLVG